MERRQTAWPIPATTLQALLYQGTASGQNTNNATDYALTSGAATFTNNAGTNFTIVPEPCSLTLAGIGLVMTLAGIGMSRRRAIH